MKKIALAVATVMTFQSAAPAFAAPPSAADTRYFFRKGYGVGATTPSTPTDPQTPEETGIVNNSASFSGQVGKIMTAALSAPAGKSVARWELESGVAPQGVSFDAGVFSGSPSAVGRLNGIIVVGYDAANIAIVRTTVSIEVIAASIPSATANWSGRAGTVFGQDIPAPGGVVVTSWAAATALPAGLSVSGTRVVGTPSSAGTTALRIQGSRDGVVVAEVIGSIAVAAAPSIATINDRIVYQNVPLTVTPVLRDAVGAVTWAVEGDALPGTLAFDTQNGVITGMVPTWNTTARVRVRATETDGGASAVSNWFNVGTPAATTNIASTPNQYLTLGKSFAMSFGVSGLTGTQSWNVAAGELPAGLSLNSETGAISGTPTEAGVKSVAVHVATSDGAAATSNVFSIDVAQPIVVSALPIANGRVNKAYSFSSSATGGTAPLTYSAVGSWPSGLSVGSTSGVVSGYPGQIGYYPNLTIRATDLRGRTGESAPFAIDVAQGISASYNINRLRVGRAETLTPSVTGAIGALTFNISAGNQNAMPDGMTIDTSTGVISGTPTRAGSFATSYLVTDADGARASMLFNVTVDPPPSLAYTSGRSVVPGQEVGLSPSTNARAGATFALNTGSLPSGITVDSSTGVVTGSASQLGTNNVTVRVTDTDGAVGTSNNIKLVISNAPEVFIDEVPAGKAYRSYVLAPTYDNIVGSPVYSYSGTLPPGLAHSSLDGRITGTPTTAGTYGNIVLSVRDNRNSLSSSSPISITVAPGIVVSKTDPAKWRAGMTSSMQLSATNVEGGATWSVSSGTLPSGVTLNTSTGLVSGTPASAGTFNATFRVVDSFGAYGTLAATFNVQAGVAVSYADKLLDPGTELNLVPTVSNPVGATTFTLAAGSLPTGISLNASTGALTGLPSGSGVFGGIRIRVTDSENTSSLSNTFRIAVTESSFLIATDDVYSGEVFQPLTILPRAMLGTQDVGRYVTWYLASGTTLPPGMTFNGRDGTISGTPTAYGNWTMRVRAYYGSEAAVSDEFQVTISDRPTLGLSVQTSVTARVGTQIDILPEASNLQGTAVWSVNPATLPAGLSFDRSSGHIFGKTSVVGNTTFRLTLTDGQRSVTSDPITISIVDGLNVSYVNQTVNRVGTMFVATPTVTGATGGTRWSLESGNLPPGTTFDSTSGVISGTLTTVGSYIVKMRVVDGEGATASVQNTYAITAKPSVAQINDINSAVNVAVSRTPAVTGTVGTVTWTRSGTLPEGLTFNGTTGAITGTPTVPGSYGPFTLTATDSQGLSATSNAFSIDIKNTTTPTVSMPATILAARGEANISVKPTVTGFESVTNNYILYKGTTAHSTSVSQLPAGLTFNASTGEITGSPTGASANYATYKVSVYAKAPGASSNAYHDSNTFTIQVQGYPDLTAEMPAVVTGERYKALTVVPTLKNVYGTVSYSMTALSGGSWQSVPNTVALPSGLTFSTTTGIITGTPTNAGTSTSYRIYAYDNRTGGAVGTYTNDFTFNVSDVPAPEIVVEPSVTVERYANFEILPRLKNTYGATTVYMQYKSAGQWYTSPSTNFYKPAGTTVETTTGRFYGPATAVGSGTYRWYVTDNRPGGLVAVYSDEMTFTVTDVSLPTVTVPPVVRGTIGELLNFKPSLNNIVRTDPPQVYLQGKSAGSWIDSSNTSFPKPSGFVSPNSNDGSLSFTPTGAFSGTPYRYYVVDVRNGSSVVAYSDEFQLIIPSLPAPVVKLPATSFPLKRYETPINLTPTFENIFGPSKTVTLSYYVSGTTWSQVSGTTGLPAGVTYNSTTYTLSGTPTQPGVFKFKYYVYDVRSSAPLGSYGDEFSLIVEDAAAPKMTFASVNTEVGTYTQLIPTLENFFGATRSFTLYYKSGASWYAYGNASFRMPTGMTWNATTGVIEGTPTAAFSGRFRIYYQDGRSPSVAAGYTDEFQITVTATAEALSVQAAPVNGVKFSPLTSNTPDVGGVTGTVTYELLTNQFGYTTGTMAGIGFDTATGRFTGNPSAAATYRGVAIKATDSAGKTGTSDEVIVTIADRPAVTVETPMIVSATKLSPISMTPPSVANTVGTVTYALLLNQNGYSGSIPAGLTFNTATGVFDGTPTVIAKTRGFAIQATDSQGYVGTSKEFAIDVVDRPAVTITGSLSYDLDQGVQFVSNAPTVTNVVGGASYALLTNQNSQTSTALASLGLSFDTTTGIISGTPTTAGTFRGYAIKVTDGQGYTAQTDEIMIVVKAKPAMSIEVPNLVVASQFEPFSTPAPYVENLDGQVTYTLLTGQNGWAAQTPPVPFDTATGTFTGTSNAYGTWRGYTIRATETINGTATGRTATSTEIMIKIDQYPALQIAAPATMNVTRGVAFTSPAPVVTNARGTVTYGLVTNIGGATSGLPTGLSINPATGVISGTVAAGATAGNFRGYGITVTDQSGRATVTSAEFFIRVE